MPGAKISQEKTDEIVSWLYTTGKVEKVKKPVKHFRRVYVKLRDGMPEKRRIFANREKQYDIF